MEYLHNNPSLVITFRLISLSEKSWCCCLFCCYYYYISDMTSNADTRVIINEDRFPFPVLVPPPLPRSYKHCYDLHQSLRVSSVWFSLGHHHHHHHCRSQVLSSPDWTSEITEILVVIVFTTETTDVVVSWCSSSTKNLIHKYCGLGNHQTWHQWKNSF